MDMSSITYQSHLSGKKRLTLELLLDAGWAAYLTGFALYLTNGADGLGTVALSATFLLNCLAVLAVVVGIIGMIAQRIRGINRTVQKGDLIFGFGFVIFGALGGFLLSGASAVIDIVLKYETGMCFAAQIIMAAGALVCFAFGLPILRSFKSEKA